MSTDPAAFGSLLRSLRLRAGLSQHAVADVALTGDHAYLSRLEGGTRHPSRATCFGLGNALAAALEVDARDLGDTLAVRAAWLPRDVVGYALRAEPELAELARLLGDETVPEHVRRDARATVRLLVAVVAQARDRGEQTAAD